MTDPKYIDIPHARKSVVLGAFALGLATAAAVVAFGSAATASDGGWRDFFAPETDATADADLLRQDDPLASDQLAESTATSEGDEEWMITSPFANVSWPEIKMPKFTWTSPWGSPERGEGGWFAAPIAKARNLSHSAIEGTRTAWNSAIDRMKFALPGREEASLDSAAQVAESETPGFWQRMFGSQSIETMPSEPDDVVEMMAQEPGYMTR